MSTLQLNEIMSANSSINKFIVGKDNIMHHASGKNVYIFGAGSSAKYVIDIFNNYLNILGVIDNNPEKWGKRVHELLIYSPENIDKKSMIIIASSFQSDINNSLIVRGFNKYNIMHFPLVDIIGAKHYDAKYILNNIIEINNIYDCLNDDKSKEIYDSILCYRCTGNLSYLNDINTPNEQYFPNIVNIKSHEVLYDLGAFDGDTVKDFIELIKKKKLEQCKVVCFEPNSNNSMLIKKKFHNNKNLQIYIEESVVSSCIDSFSFDDKGAETRYDENNSVTNSMVKSIDLDTYIDTSKIIPTYIKMDVEGFEKEVIEGGVRCIMNYRPKLAISIYHKPSDIWLIPKIMISILDNYNFFIRHHSNNINDTVLYCIPKEDKK